MCIRRAEKVSNIYPRRAVMHNPQGRGITALRVDQRWVIEVMPMMCVMCVVCGSRPGGVMLRAEGMMWGQPLPKPVQ